MENTLGGEEVYQTRVTKHLVPCVGQFCVAVGDDTLWKTLNYQILLKTRHSSSKVRRQKCEEVGLDSQPSTNRHVIQVVIKTIVSWCVSAGSAQKPCPPAALQDHE